MKIGAIFIVQNYYEIETRGTCFLFFVDNSAMKKRKQPVTLIIKMYIILSSYANTILNHLWDIFHISIVHTSGASHFSNRPSEFSPGQLLYPL